MKNIVTILLVCASFITRAGLPSGASPLAPDNTLAVNKFRITNSIFVLEKKKQVAADVFSGMQLSEFNSVFITGMEKKEESKINSLLNFDFKVKFKLNKNMNIIFSYN